LTGAGWLLIGGALVYFVGGYLVASRNPSLARADAATAEGLRAIATHPGQWRATLGMQAVAIGMTAWGLAAFARSVARDARAEVWIAAAVFGAGAVLMLVYLGFHGTVTVRAAEGYESRRRRFARLYRVYMILAYLAFAELGASAGVHHALVAWIASLLLLAGAFGAATMVVRRPVVRGLVVSDLPLWVYVLAGLLGMALLSAPR
jgi:hypothetical protein